MSFDLILSLACERPAIDAEAVLRHATDAALGPLGGSVVTGDHAVEFSAGVGGTLSILRGTDDTTGLSVRVAQLGPFVSALLFELATAFALAIYNAQGRDTTDSPGAILVAASPTHEADLAFARRFYAVPAVIGSAAQLLEVLAPSFEAFAAYRDQVIGRDDDQVAVPSPTDAPSAAQQGFDAASLRPFFDLITEPLAGELREQAWQRILALSPRTTPDAAWHEAFSSFDTKGPWLYLQTDARDAGEIEWQGLAIARTLGLEGDFAWSPPDYRVSDRTLTGYLALDRWLAGRGYRLLFISDADDHSPPGDTYAAVPMRAADCERAERLARDGGLNVIPLGPPPSANGVEVRVVEPTSAAGLRDAVVDAVRDLVACGSKPVAYVSAYWCRPCRETLGLLMHPELAPMLRRHAIGLVLVDIALCLDQLSEIEVYPSAVPFLTTLTMEGTGAGHEIDGGAWDEETVENLLQALDPYFATC